MHFRHKFSPANKNLLTIAFILCLTELHLMKLNSIELHSKQNIA